MKYKLRAIVSNSKFGKYFGLTAPKEAVERFGEETRFSVKVKKDKIIYESGAHKNVR